MRKIVIVFFALLCALSAENYKKIRIAVNENEMEKISALEIPLEDITKSKDGLLEIILSDKQIEKMKKRSIDFEVIIDNWEEYYKKNRIHSRDRFNLSKINSRYAVSGFTFGSMGGFYTYDEIWQKIDEMILNYPNLISHKEQIGLSLENKPIYAVKISDNPNTDEDEPEVLYTALHHSKEPMSMMQMIYFMFYLLENYENNNEVAYLLNNRELYFIPVVNPDGYVYNQKNYPNGGGMWRKNRRLNDDGSYGIDLNRNYGYKWGYDNSGSSGTPSSDIYRGTAPFSEPETEAVRQFCNVHRFVMALNYHSRGNLLISPWGYTDSATPDSLFYMEISPEITRYNNYEWGTFNQIIYKVNGGATDWFYGEQEEKDKILAMTVEVGNMNDGVWPGTNRIIPLAEENVYPNLYAGWVSGEFIDIENISFNKSYYLPGDDGSVSINLKNKGLKNCN